jgi:hypothetical protein
MSIATKLVLGFMILMIIGVVGIVSYVISAKFTANEFETSITYSDKDNQNIYSNMNKIMDASGLTVQNYGDTKIKAIQEEVKRYADKPALMAQFVKENPQQIDSKIWEKFMDMYEKNTVAIQNAQTSRLSKAQEYQTWLGSTGKGFIAGTVFNYPTPECKKTMERVIETKQTKDTWETGIDQTPRAFGK